MSDLIKEIVLISLQLHLVPANFLIYLTSGLPLAIDKIRNSEMGYNYFKWLKIYERSLNVTKIKGLIK